MNKKDIFLPFTFVALSLIFVVICVMVYLSKGKSKKWIARKMTIGSLLLAMTAVSCHSHRIVELNATCYDVSIAVDSVETVYYPTSSETTQLNVGELIFNDDKKIHGNIKGARLNKLSFLLMDSLGHSILKGNLMDGDNFNQISGDFEIKLKENPHPGKYTLKIYSDGHVENKVEKILIINPKNE